MYAKAAVLGYTARVPCSEVRMLGGVDVRR